MTKDTRDAQIEQTVLRCLFVKMVNYDSTELLKMLSKSTIDFESIGQKKSIIFVEISDTDKSCDNLVNLFFSQLTNSLCNYADEECKDGRLQSQGNIPVSVH